MRGTNNSNPNILFLLLISTILVALRIGFTFAVLFGGIVGGIVAACSSYFMIMLLIHYNVYGDGGR